MDETTVGVAVFVDEVELGLEGDDHVAAFGESEVVGRPPDSIQVPRVGGEQIGGFGEGSGCPRAGWPHSIDSLVCRGKEPTSIYRGPSKGIYPVDLEVLSVDRGRVGAQIDPIAGARREDKRAKVDVGVVLIVVVGIGERSQRRDAGQCRNIVVSELDQSL